MIFIGRKFIILIVTTVVSSDIKVETEEREININNFQT